MLAARCDGIAGKRNAEGLHIVADCRLVGAAQYAVHQRLAAMFAFFDGSLYTDFIAPALSVSL